MTFLEAVRSGLEEALNDRSVYLLSQLGRYGLGGLTNFVGHADQQLTFPVCENAMHSAGMGMALAGLRPVVINERMDFLALAMDPLLNHIPVWQARHPLALPLTVIAVVGKGKGQGPQHSKNIGNWFREFEGWNVSEPNSPEAARVELLRSIFGSSPVLYVLHREFFKAENEVSLPISTFVGLCGASARHEREFYKE
jgi:acetoin:2,6-dichlorophenolindophenol oxidoreductase subunit beta